MTDNDDIDQGLVTELIAEEGHEPHFAILIATLAARDEIYNTGTMKRGANGKLQIVWRRTSAPLN